MRRTLLSICLVVVGCLFFAQSWAVCPEEPNDNGECDTLHVDIYPADQEPAGDPPHFVRFPIRVTHDIVDPATDSLAGFGIPLCYTHSNPSAYCSLTDWWNTTSLNPYDPAMERSIFRDLDEESNLLYDIYGGLPPYPYIQLDLDGTSHFYFAIISTEPSHQRISDGSRMLIATMTFKMEDTASICIDSCFWPPSDRLGFHNSAAQIYIPRHYLPICEMVGPQPHPPVFTSCPPTVYCNSNKIFGSEIWEAEDAVDNIDDISAEFVGSGVTDVEVWYLGTPPPPVAGYIRFEVMDHCASGGIITITARDEAGYEGYCEFEVELINDPPDLSLSDTLEAIENYTSEFWVSATDPNNDLVEISFNGLWYEPDSLQSPTNSPSFGGHLFSWVPTEAEEGLWICSFTATDACGAEQTEQVVIVVGPLFCGEVNDNGILNLDDGTKLLTYLFKGGSVPDPLCKGDANCDLVVDVSDVIRILNYLFKSGPAPCFGCCEE
jgi:hypothetical protein